MAKFYVRANDEGIVTWGFSDECESPLSTDYCIDENAEGLFSMFGENLPCYINSDGTHRFRYDNGSVRFSTEDEMNAEKETIPHEEEYATVSLEERINDLEMAICELYDSMAEV